MCNDDFFYEFGYYIASYSGGGNMCRYHFFCASGKRAESHHFFNYRKFENAFNISNGLEAVLKENLAKRHKTHHDIPWLIKAKMEWGAT